MADTQIKTYIDGIITSKTNIKTSLNNKGCSISDTNLLSTYSTFIDNMLTIYTSTTTPTSSTGKNGDIWLVKSS